MINAGKISSGLGTTSMNSTAVLSSMKGAVFSQPSSTQMKQMAVKFTAHTTNVEMKRTTSTSSAKSTDKVKSQKTALKTSLTQSSGLS